MKSIILAGTARSGKTTLARRLQKETGFSLISGDALMCTFEAIYPQLGISHEGKWDDVCKKWEDFIFVYLKHLTTYEHIPFIFDTFHLMPEQIARLGMHEKYTVAFLGYPGLTAAQKMADIRQYKTEHYDWTAERTDEELTKDVAEFVERSKWLQQECTRLSLNFIDTSNNFQQNLDAAFAKIMQNQ